MQWEWVDGIYSFVGRHFSIYNFCVWISIFNVNKCMLIRIFIHSGSLPGYPIVDCTAKFAFFKFSNRYHSLFRFILCSMCTILIHRSFRPEKKNLNCLWLFVFALFPTFFFLLFLLKTYYSVLFTARKNKEQPNEEEQKHVIFASNTTKTYTVMVTVISRRKNGKNWKRICNENQCEYAKNEKTRKSEGLKKGQKIKNNKKDSFSMFFEPKIWT